MATTQNYKDKKSTNTTGPSFMNVNGHQASVLRVGYWDERVKLEFIPELPEAQRTQDKKFDYKAGVQAILVPEKAYALYQVFKQHIEPAIRENKDVKKGVIIAETNVILVASGADRPDEDGNPRPYIALYKDLDPDTRLPKIQISYEFRTTEVIDNYDPTTGNFGGITRCESEIDIIMDILGEFHKASSNMYAHSDKYTNMYSVARRDDNIVKIGEKLGLDLAYKPNNYSNGTYGSIFDKGSKPTGVAPQVDEETLSSLDDLNL